MVDVAKRINKKSEQLLPGEAVTVGTFCSPTGSFGAAMAFGVVGMVVAEAKATKNAAKAVAAAPDAMASKIPGAKTLVGLTQNRLVFFGFGAMVGGATDLVAAFDLSQIHSIDADHKAAKSIMTLTFADGSTRPFESVRGGKPKDFVEALQSALAQRAAQSA